MKRSSIRHLLGGSRARPGTRRLAAPASLAATLALGGLVLSACGSGPAATSAPPTAAAPATTTSSTQAPPASTAAPGPPFSTVALSVPAGNGAAPFDQPRTLTVPTGWTAEVWARVTGARFAAWSPQHALLVSVPGTGQVVELEPGTNPAAVPSQTVLLPGLTEPQGMAFDKLDGQEVLYVAESDQIDRYVWKGGGEVGARTIVVAGLPDTDPSGDDVHRVKELAIGPDQTIYVDIGSSSNAGATDETATPPRGVVMAYRPNGSGGHVFASGVRNGDGLSFDPDGELWTAVNERDNIAYPFHQPYGGLADAFGQVLQPYVNDHPPDELAKLTAGRTLGWPYCDPDPDVTPGSATTTLQYANLPLVADAQTNPGGTALDCASLAPIERGIPAHSAPLGFHFLEGSALPAPWSGGAVVAVHGSWDRTPPRGPAVLWFPWEASGKTLGTQVDLVTGFQTADGSRWGRPVDAIPGSDGALYVTDDTAGAVYRMVPSR